MKTFKCFFVAAAVVALGMANISEAQLSGLIGIGNNNHHQHSLINLNLGSSNRPQHSGHQSSSVFSGHSGWINGVNGLSLQNVNTNNIRQDSSLIGNSNSGSSGISQGSGSGIYTFGSSVSGEMGGSASPQFQIPNTNGQSSSGGNLNILQGTSGSSTQNTYASSSQQFVSSSGSSENVHVGQQLPLSPIPNDGLSGNVQGGITNIIGQQISSERQTPDTENTSSLLGLNINVGQILSNTVEGVAGLLGGSSSSSSIVSQGQSSASGIAQILPTVQPSITPTQNPGQNMAGSSSSQSPSANAGNSGRPQGSAQNYIQGYYYIVDGTKYYVSQNGATAVPQGGPGSSPLNGIQSGVTVAPQGGQGSLSGNGPISSTVQPSIVKTQNAGHYISSDISNQNSITETSKNVTSSVQTVSSVVGINTANSGSPQESAPNGVESNPSRPNVNGGIAGNSSPQSPSANAGNPARPQGSAQNNYQGYYYIVDGTKYYVSQNGAIVVPHGGLGSSPGNGAQSGVTVVPQGGQGSSSGNGPISSTVQPSIVPTQNAGHYISFDISNQNSITETSQNVASSVQTVSSVVGINTDNSGSPQENVPNGVESNPSRPNVNGGIAGNSSPQYPSVNAGNPGRPQGSGQNYIQGYYYIVDGTKYYVSQNGATVVQHGGLGSSSGNGAQSGVTELPQGGQGSTSGNGSIAQTVQPSIFPTQNAGHYISSDISNQNSIAETSKNVASPVQTVSSVVGINTDNSGSPQENVPNGVESNPSRPNVNGGIAGNSSPQSPSANAGNPGRPQGSAQNYYIVDGTKYYVSQNGATVVPHGGLGSSPGNGAQSGVTVAPQGGQGSSSGNGPISSTVQPSIVPNQNAGHYISSDISNQNSITETSQNVASSVQTVSSVVGINTDNSGSPQENVPNGVESNPSRPNVNGGIAGNSSPQYPSVNAGNPGRPQGSGQNYIQGYYYIVDGTKYYVSQNGATVVPHGGLGSSPGNGAQSGVTVAPQEGQGSPSGNGSIAPTVQPSIFPTQNAGHYISSDISNQNSITETSQNVTSSVQTVSSVVGINTANSGSPQESAPNGVESNPSRPNVNGGIAGNSSPQSPSANAGNPARPQGSAQNNYQGYYYIVDGTKYYVSQNGATVVPHGGLGSSPGNGAQSGVTVAPQGGQGSPSGNGPISSTVQPSTVPTQNAGQYISSGISNQNSITETSNNVTSSVQTVSSVVPVLGGNGQGSVSGSGSSLSESERQNSVNENTSLLDVNLGLNVGDVVKGATELLNNVLVGGGSSQHQSSSTNTNGLSSQYEMASQSAGQASSAITQSGSTSGSAQGGISTSGQIAGQASSAIQQIGSPSGSTQGGSSTNNYAQEAFTSTNGLSSQYEMASQIAGQASSAITQSGSLSGSAHRGSSTNNNGHQASGLLGINLSIGSTPTEASSSRHQGGLFSFLG
ncbi:uncharacterized protein LOC129914961 [Episyrphus balteatus]|uniref:uncharacterized protein LOC129914961 n=1 Tax=Episyrphus balteatus TaxID=286459 RepID=UPI0024856CF4|nr:uncharacterized protein LOC129914961 [Episyrphus balteatus]